MHSLMSEIKEISETRTDAWHSDYGFEASTTS